MKKRLTLAAGSALLLIGVVLSGMPAVTHSTAHTASAVIADTGDPTPTPTPTPLPQPNGGGCQTGGNCGD